MNLCQRKVFDRHDTGLPPRNPASCHIEFLTCALGRVPKTMS